MSLEAVTAVTAGVPDVPGGPVLVDGAEDGAGLVDGAGADALMLANPWARRENMPGET